MKICPGCAQNIGSRKEQQDSFGFSHIEDQELVRRAGILAVVADGMGGLAMGRESSDITVKSILSVHESSYKEANPVDTLINAVDEANRAVLAMADYAGVAGEAGSTVVAVIVKDSKLYWISVGDSRIYLYRNEELIKLNTEQNYASELNQRVASGEISQKDADDHPDSAALTNFIGSVTFKSGDGNVRPFLIENGDWLVLCSDGLFGTLDDDEIRGELFNNPNDASERLIKRVIAKKREHQDNVTVAILACGEKDPVTVKTPKSQKRPAFQPAPAKKKGKKLIPLIIVAVLFAVVLGGVWALVDRFLSRKPETTPANQPSNNSISAKNPPEKTEDTKQNVPDKPKKGEKKPAKQKPTPKKKEKEDSDSEPATVKSGPEAKPAGSAKQQ